MHCAARVLVIERVQAETVDWSLLKDGPNANIQFLLARPDVERNPGTNFDERTSRRSSQRIDKSMGIK
jgi:hypothetical protein